MISNETIEQLFAQHQNEFAFARACYAMGCDDQKKRDAEIAEKHPFSLVIGKNIAHSILTDKGE